MRDVSEIADIQSESGIVGTLLIHPEYCEYSDFLKPEYFMGEDNAHLYRAIVDLYKSGIRTMDAYNLSLKISSNADSKFLAEKYNLPQMSELITLYSQVARETIEDYQMLVDIVITNSFKRDLIRSLRTMDNHIFRGKEDLDELSNYVYDTLDQLTGRYLTGSPVKSFGDLIDDIWQEIEERRNHDGTVGIPSKIRGLDEYMSYEPTELVVVAARMKKGKSIFLMNEAIDKLRKGIPVLYVETEMSDRPFLERVLSHLTQIEVRRIKSGRYTEAEALRIRNAMDWLKHQPLVHLYDPKMSMEQMYSLCKKLQREINLGFVIYDYVKCDEKDTSANYNLLGQITNSLKNVIAGQLNLPVLTAVQLNRSDDVADSDKIQRYLSTLIRLDEKPREMIERDGKSCGNYFLKVSLNRNGKMTDMTDPDDYIDLFLDADRMTFADAQKHDLCVEF